MMNVCYRNIFFVMILMFGLSGYSQVVIERKDYPISLGSKILLYSVSPDTSNPVIDVTDLTLTGPELSWAFYPSDFPGGEVDTITVVDPISTPFSSSFSQADHAFLMTDTASSGGQIVKMKFYAYFQRTNNALLELGGGVEVPPFLSSFRVYTPSVIDLPFPASLNTAWENNYSTRDRTPEGLMVDSMSSESVVDAWGSIESSIGVFPECLRVREKASNFEFKYSPSGALIEADTSHYIQYTWFAKGVGVIAFVQSVSGDTSFNFTSASEINFRVDSTISGIQDPTPGIISSLQLYQNYPNPFNPKTTISFHLPRRMKVDVEIFDISGKKIAVLASRKFETGLNKVNFIAQDLPSGLYFYRIKGQGIYLTKQMLLLK